MRRRLLVMLSLTLVLTIAGLYSVNAWTPVPVSQDPLVRMPGTQPGQVALQAPTRCLNCHAGYDSAVEPGFNWKGSMMAQSARDFLFWSCLTVGAQDSIWAAGRPNATDICERCHFPKGWLEGRSDPPNASAMTGADFDGVQCDFCHTMYDPFFETTYAGTREGSDWLNYWDETNASGTPSQPAADAAYAEDMTLAQSIVQFNLDPFFTNNLPPVGYTESGSGQYFVSPNGEKRASFADADARHKMFYSRYHKSKYFCDTCHDVSNPVLANLGADPANPLPTELNSASSYFHVERTFSEFMLSAYSQPGGAPGMGPFDPSVYQTSDSNNNIRMCQDCHMRDVVGPGCDLQGAVVRPSQSVEHPQSGQPLHDLTGGNAWVSYVLASIDPNNPNMDQFNYDRLVNQVNGPLTLDVTQGEGLDYQALLAGVDRAKQQLLLAASIENLAYDPSSGHLSFRVQNQTGHKLISGFPEGRRMFVNIKAYLGGSLIYEVNPYDADAGTLKGLDYPYQSGMGLPAPLQLAATEAYMDELVYEMKPSSTDLTGETKTFHFALATGRYKDNRIPPKGFNIDAAADRLSVPVWHGVEDPNYFTAAEYAGGYDEMSLTIAKGADNVEINLYYQTTSREYIEFLRDEINGTDNLTLSSPTPSGELNAYVVQTDPFFAQLKAWGDTMWQLWTHNMNVDGAKPFTMTQATVVPPPPPCGAPTPTLIDAVPVSGKVTLTWTDEHTADPNVLGYKVYYDQAGKAQFHADAGLTTSFTDSGLVNGVQYCYKVTSYYATCESAYSNVLCAVPVPGGGDLVSSVTMVETGKWVTTGKGKNQTTSFVLTDVFNAGDEVVFRAYVVDPALPNTPLPGATVELSITGPETLTLTTGPSDVNGMAETVWQTQAPRKKTPGTATGQYWATVANVTATGYVWDSVPTSTTFTIQ